MSDKKLSAFTLVELLVAMGIIGVLIGLSLFGIAAAQRNARDTARRAATQDINAGIADYFTQTGNFPRGIGFRGDVVVITNPPASSCGTANCVEVPLDSAARVGTTQVLTTGTTEVGSTTTDSSRWCFVMRNDGYSLSVELESGENFQGGTSVTDCPLP